MSKVKSAARVAASNTSSTPSPVKEEHSRYLRAPMLVPVSLPSLAVTNLRDFLRISSMASGSSRRSFLRPTRIMGTPGHRSFASSIHYQTLVAVIICLADLTHLVFHVLQGVWCIHSEADQEDMGLRVCQWAQSFIIFLSSCIPKSQLYRAAIDSAIRYIVFEYCRDLGNKSDLLNGSGGWAR